MRSLCFAVFFAAFTSFAASLEVRDEVGGEIVAAATDDLRRCLKGADATFVLTLDPTLGEQTWRVTAKGGVVALAGRDVTSLVYGIYGYLERYAGCRWYAPDTELLPERAGWRPPDVTATHAPAILGRECYVGYDYMRALWRLRNRETRRAAWGLGRTIGAPRDNHTFAHYARYLAAHGGVMAGAGFCLSAKTNRLLAAACMKNYIRADRADFANRALPREAWPRTYVLEQDDGGNAFPCTCADCRRLFADAGNNWSGPNIDFASAVATEVIREFPDIDVLTGAYSFTERAPANAFRAHPGLAVIYCRSFLFQPLTDKQL